MFVLEVRKTSGTKYAPGSIWSLLSGLSRHLKENKVLYSIFDDQHPEFCELCKTYDVVSSSLHKEGLVLIQRRLLSLQWMMRIGIGKWDCWDILQQKYYKGLFSFILACGLF